MLFRSAVSSIFGGSSGGLVSTIAGKVLDPVKDYVWGGISGLFGGGEIEAGTGLVSAGGGSSLLGTIGSYAGWAAAAVSVMNHFTELNQESGRNNIYSAENGTTQIGNALNGNVFNDPITGWLSGAVNGNDSTRSSMAYLDAALANGNWDEIMKAGLASGIEASFTDPIINALAGNQIAKIGRASCRERVSPPV